MNCPDCMNRLDDYVGGELAARDLAGLEQHLAECAACRSALASLRSLRQLAITLPRDVQPRRDLWPDIVSQLRRPAGPGAQETAAESKAAASVDRATSRLDSAMRWFVPLAVAAVVTMLASVAQRQLASRFGPTGWTVASLAGTPRVNTTAISSSGRLRTGQWLETDAASRAKVVVGAIGEVSIEPNSRVRLIDSSEHEHRLELARGTLNALIWAPPRLFFVNTPSATAVDLGCAYTLNVADDGSGELSVTAGYVALQHGDREVVIPHGMNCRTRPGVGPGTPFAADADADLRASLEAFDFAPGGRAAALDRILSRTQPADAITLWHLIARAPAAQRGGIFDVLARQQPPPAGVTRAGIVAGDSAMRNAWGAALGLQVSVQP